METIIIGAVIGLAIMTVIILLRCDDAPDDRYTLVKLDYGYHVFDRNVCREIPRRFQTETDAILYIRTH